MKPWVALLWSAFVFKALVTLLGLDRGFELGDEGYFLLSLNHPETTPANFEFYKLLMPLGLVFDVVDARLLRIGAEALGGVALISGLFVFARERLFPPGVIRLNDLLPFCLLGTGIHVASRSFSYNDMTNLCTYAATGALFILASRSPEAGDRRTRTLAALAMGFFTGFQLAVKFPAFFLLVIVLAGAVTFLLRRLPPRERARVLLTYGAGVVVAWLLFVLRNGGIAPLVERYVFSTQVAPIAGYDPAAILTEYVKGEVLTVPNILLALAVYAVVRWGCEARFRSSRDFAMAAGIVSAVAALAASVWTLHPFFFHPSLLWLSCFVAFALLVSGWHVTRRPFPGPGTVSDRLLLLVPLSLPVVNLMGSNVPFTMRLPSHALPLFGVLGVFSLLLARSAGRRRFHAAIACLGVAVTTVSFVQHHVRAPYGLRQPLHEQRERVAGLPGIHVDVATRTFLESSAALMEDAGFRRGDPVLALDYMPGLVFYLGGTSPGWPFYMFGRPALNCFNLRHAALERIPFVIVGADISPEQSACVEAFDLPGDFRELGALHFPYDGVYEGFGAEGLERVRFFAPRPGARLRAEEGS